MATVGENIRKHRKAQGLSVVGLAEKVGMTEGAIRHYESGIRTPGEDQLKKITREPSTCRRRCSKTTRSKARGTW